MTHSYPRHSHPSYAVGVIEGGTGGNVYRGSTCYIPAGDIVAMNPDEAHTGFPAGNGPLTYRMFYVELTAFDEMQLAPGALPFFRDVRIRSSHWAGRLVALHRLLETSGNALEQQTAWLDTFARFSMEHGCARAVPDREDPGPVRRAKEFLKAHCRENVTLDEVSVVAGITSAHLIRSFRRAVGITPYAWLLQSRIEEAKTLLARGTALADVALETGFADQSHFTRRFKALVGVTPGQYAAGHYRSR